MSWLWNVGSLKSTPPQREYLHYGNQLQIRCFCLFIWSQFISPYYQNTPEHQSPHSWLFLHYQEIEWLWTSHTTSLTFSLFIYKRWSWSSWPSSLLTPLKFCYIVSPSSIIPTYNTTKQHISVNSCDFRQSFYAPQDGVGLCPPLRSHCSPRIPFVFWEAGL